MKTNITNITLVWSVLGAFLVGGLVGYYAASGSYATPRSVNSDYGASTI
jgi:hypothetical protein